MRPPRRLCTLLLIGLTVSGAAAQQTPTPAAAPWWNETSALANDSMEGRDTGTAAYERAARYVAAKFKAAGLQPAGDDGTFFQRVPMHEIDLDTAHSAVEILKGADADGLVAGTAPSSIRLELLQQVTLAPRSELPSSVEGQMVFVGYGTPGADTDLQGKVAVYFNNVPASIPAADRDAYIARRARELAASGAVAILSIDNPGAIEPFHWPAAYARSVTLAPSGANAVKKEPASAFAPVPVLRVSSEAAAELFLRSGHQIGDIRRDGVAGAPLASFPIPNRLRIRIQTTSKDISSPNILAVLPGSDPALAPEYVALSAHLDGYGYGTPVLGDPLYNGALDDAAYVATLLELARKEAARAPRPRLPLHPSH